MSNLQQFQGRLEAFRGKIDRLEQAGTLSKHEGWLVRDALFAWSSGESSHTWISRSALTADLLEKMKREEIWPWDRAPGK